MTEHRWSGWPGAWCLDCGCDDPREIALADGNCDDDGTVHIDPALMECPEPGSRRYDPDGRTGERPMTEDELLAGLQDVR